MKSSHHYKYFPAVYAQLHIYFISFATYGAKLLNADWLKQRAFRAHFFLITKARLVIKRA